jgi:hypothetical protein
MPIEHVKWRDQGSQGRGKHGGVAGEQGGSSKNIKAICGDEGQACMKPRLDCSCVFLDALEPNRNVGDPLVVKLFSIDLLIERGASRAG